MIIGNYCLGELVSCVGMLLKRTKIDPYVIAHARRHTCEAIHHDGNIPANGNGLHIMPSFVTDSIMEAFVFILLIHLTI